MAVMEVNLPSGFTANMDSLPALRRYKGVKRVDTEKSDTKVVLYFETLTRSEVCPTFSAYRTHRVAKQGCQFNGLSFVDRHPFIDRSGFVRQRYCIDFVGSHNSFLHFVDV